MGLFWVARFLMRDFQGGKITLGVFFGKKITAKELARASFVGGRFFKKDLVVYAPLLQAESRTAIEEIRNPNKIVYKKPNLPIFLLCSNNDKLFSRAEQKELAKAYKKTSVFLPNMCHDMMLDIEWKKGAQEILKFIQKKVL